MLSPGPPCRGSPASPSGPPDGRSSRAALALDTGERVGLIGRNGSGIGDGCLIGINATVMDTVKIGPNSIVAGHSIVTEGAAFPENSVIAGVRAKQVAVRDNADANLFNARFHHLNAMNYAEGVDRIDPDAMAALCEA